MCEGIPIDSTVAAEKYLQTRIPEFVDVSVKLIHTYSSWTTPSGLFVKIGTGLTKEHLCQAMEFLGGNSCSYCERRGTYGTTDDDLLINIGSINGVSMPPLQIQ